jgi:site-specific recombinase XerD
MTPIAPHITAFLRQRLPLERAASENTCESYAYAFKLLFQHASARLKIAPADLSFEQIDAPLVLDFLDHLEKARGNGPSSRNIRLAAIKSFMRFMELRVPAALEQIRQVLAIPSKKCSARIGDYLTGQEMEVILNGPDPARRNGVRDRAMLHLCFTAGLRVSELIGLRMHDLKLQQQASVLIHGKGRRQRCLPLWRETASALRGWVAVRGEVSAQELFLNTRNEPMTRSGFEYILRKYVRRASRQCTSLLTKRISPHALRRTCALTVLQATRDLRKVSLWLGHANMHTTENYTRLDPSVKLEIIESVIPPKLRSGRFKASDKLIASL